MSNFSDVQIARFWGRVLKTESCWLWAATPPTQYGSISLNGKTYMAHRLSYILANGPIDDGRLVCHKCDIPGCVRPDHLFLGTHADNSLDMVAKGRSVSPSKRRKRKPYGSYYTYIAGKLYATVHVKKSDGRYTQLRRRISHVGEAAATAKGLKLAYQQRLESR